MSQNQKKKKRREEGSKSIGQLQGAPWPAPTLTLRLVADLVAGSNPDTILGPSSYPETLVAIAPVQYVGRGQQNGWPCCAVRRARGSSMTNQGSNNRSNNKQREHSGSHRRLAPPPSHNQPHHKKTVMRTLDLDTWIVPGQIPIGKPPPGSGKQIQTSRYRGVDLKTAHTFHTVI